MTAKLLRSLIPGNRNLLPAPLFRSRRFQWLAQGSATKSCIMTFDKARAAMILGANLVVLVALGPALAADASPWDGTERAAVRLIAGAPLKQDGATSIARESRSGSPELGKPTGAIRATPAFRRLRFLEVAQRQIPDRTLAAPQRLADEAACRSAKDTT